jgi:hypothetical protein
MDTAFQKLRPSQDSQRNRRFQAVLRVMQLNGEPEFLPEGGIEEGLRKEEGY